MEEHSENTSPYSGANQANGASSGSESSATASNVGSYAQPPRANGMTAAAGQANGAGAPAAAGGPAASSAMGSATNGTGGSATIGGKGLNTKRSRIAGVPPPGYSPLGASSPSLSSNSMTFPGPNAGSTSNPSSNATTPSASPQTSHSQLPSAAYGNGSGSQQQQQHQAGQTNNNSAAGAASGSGQSSSTSQMYPSLHLHPLNDTFIPKQVSLYPPGPHNRIKIGRQTNAKTVPAPSNGYFDSKVLSRMHAEVWAEGNKVYIKDVKSSNGTFINGERLSPEAVESDIFELHNNDMVEFGIDITSEDSKTIVHHKVAARCFIVMNAEDAVNASRNFSNYYRDLGDSPMHRRPGLGPGKSAMGNSGMNIDQVLSRLQTELQKSRETGADLGSLTSTIGEIHETLGGNLPGPPIPAYRVPPFVPPNPNAPPSQQQAAQESHAQTQQLLNSLQTQLQETQNALSGHVDRIRNLEGLLEEQDRMRSELKEVKERMDEARSEWEKLREDRERERSISLTDEDSDSDEKEDLEDVEHLDDDQTRTIRLDDSDLQSITTERGVQDVPDELDATGTNSLQGNEDRNDASAAFAATQARLAAENQSLAERMEALSRELSEASQLSTSLKGQYSEAAQTIRGLEEKVNTLEKALQTHRSPETSEEATSVPEKKPSPPPQEDSGHGRADILREVENRFTDWKKSFEEAVRRERQGWEEEREQLRMTLSEWEKRSESLALSQSTSAASGSGSRRKRRSKASTVSSSSDSSSDSQLEDYADEGGFVSPVTEEDSQTASKDDNDPTLVDERALLKRPRSRRRRKAPDASRSQNRVSHVHDNSRGSSALTDGEHHDGGSALRRRRSWIPFSKSFYEAQSPSDIPTIAEEPKEPHGQAKSQRPAASFIEHPALPIVSVAAAMVVGYLAHSAFIQQQK